MAIPSARRADVVSRIVRASGGTYLTLKNGVSTGCAPLKALDLTPTNLAFLGKLVRKLVTIEGIGIADIPSRRSIVPTEAPLDMAEPLLLRALRRA
mgnify:CR=1 FL=1